MCQLYNHSDWRCASESVRCVGGAEYCVRLVFSSHVVVQCSATRLLHLAQAQNVHATVELAARRSGVFNATFLPNGSDKRQRSGRIKAVGCCFKSGWCQGRI